MKNVTAPSELIPAATVILLRDHGGRLEALMLRRNRDLKSFGGAWVFPGGRVDDLDEPGGEELSRARHAAVRETREETGLNLVPQDLRPLSQWIPPAVDIRRFSTWFFVAKAPDQNVKIDDGEIHEYRWICPKQIVEQTPHAEMRIMPPTYVSLWELAHYDDADAALAGCTMVNPPLFETRFAKLESGFATMWAPDIAYESGDMQAQGPRHRLVCGKTEWNYLRSS
jgi:8-oxo-dGTP pyrophosphatase MutT (NUDIX family)